MWYMGDLRWKLDALQNSINDTVNSTQAKKIAILSSRQIGKSYWAVGHALSFAARNPGKIVRIVAPTLKQCQDIVQDNLAPICVDAPKEFITARKSDYRWELWNGSSLRLGALERAYVDGNRGGNASLVIYEECGFVKGDDFSYGVNSVLGPQLLRSNGREIYVSSPSEDPDHPLHTLVMPECTGLGTFFCYTVFDSPSIKPEQIIEAMRRSGCKVPQELEYAITNKLVTTATFDFWVMKTGAVITEAFQREYMARIIRPVTLMVIPDYDERRHVAVFDLPVRTHLEVTIDWGGVRDMTVALLHTYDYMSNMDLVWEEKVWPANTATSTIVQELKQWDKDYYLTMRWADVPGQVQVDLNETYNYTISIPQKSDWMASVNQCAVKFATDRIKIHPRCEFLRKTCRAAMFNKQRTDFERTADLGHCDGIAALMYAIRSQNRSNPYGAQQANLDNYFVRPVKDDEVEFADAVSPAAGWASQRTFGAFR